MRLTDQEKKDFINSIQDLLQHEKIYEMKEYIQHGEISTFTHSMVIAYYSYLIALRLPFQIDTKSIARGAVLHDFYLYDWHIPDKSHKLHGYRHPLFALRNAKKYFTLNRTEEDIIANHMWPLTLFHIPRCREAILLCFVDKLVSLIETFHLTTLPNDFYDLYQHISDGTYASNINS
jgi:uncharacterized protein